MSDQSLMFWAEEWICSRCPPPALPSAHSVSESLGVDVSISPSLWWAGHQCLCHAHCSTVLADWQAVPAMPMAQGRALAAGQSFLLRGTFHTHSVFLLKQGKSEKNQKAATVCLTEDLQGTLTVTEVSGQIAILPWVWEKLIRARGELT